MLADARRHGRCHRGPGRIHRRAGLGSRRKRRLRPVVPRDRGRGSRPLRDRRAAGRAVRAASAPCRRPGRVRRLGRLLRRGRLLPRAARRPHKATTPPQLPTSTPRPRSTCGSARLSGRNSSRQHRDQLSPRSGRPHPTAFSEPARSGPSPSTASRPTSPTAKDSTTSLSLLARPGQPVPAANWRASPRPPRRTRARPASARRIPEPGCASSTMTSPRPRPTTTPNAPPAPASNATPHRRTHPIRRPRRPTPPARRRNRKGPQDRHRPHPPGPAHPRHSSPGARRAPTRQPRTPAQPAATSPPSPSTGGSNKASLDTALRPAEAAPESFAVRLSDSGTSSAKCSPVPSRWHRDTPPPPPPPLPRPPHHPSSPSPSPPPPSGYRWPVAQLPGAERARRRRRDAQPLLRRWRAAGHLVGADLGPVIESLNGGLRHAWRFLRPGEALHPSTYGRQLPVTWPSWRVPFEYPGVTEYPADGCFGVRFVAAGGAGPDRLVQVPAEGRVDFDDIGARQPRSLCARQPGRAQRWIRSGEAGRQAGGGIELGLDGGLLGREL